MGLHDSVSVLLALVHCSCIVLDFAGKDVCWVAHKLLALHPKGSQAFPTFQWWMDISLLRLSTSFPHIPKLLVQMHMKII